MNLARAEISLSVMRSPTIMVSGMSVGVVPGYDENDDSEDHHVGYEVAKPFAAFGYLLKKLHVSSP